MELLLQPLQIRIVGLKRLILSLRSPEPAEGSKDDRRQMVFRVVRRPQYEHGAVILSLSKDDRV